LLYFLTLLNLEPLQAHMRPHQCSTQNLALGSRTRFTFACAWCS